MGSGRVVAGGEGSVVVRGSSGTIRRGGGSGVRFLIFLFMVGAIYLVLGSYRNEIVEKIPASFPILKALGFEVEEPAGFGLRAEVLRHDRYADPNGQGYILLINGMIENRRDTRMTIPRLRLVITSSRQPEIVVTAEPPQQSLAPRQRTRFEVRHRSDKALFDVKVRAGFEKN